MPLKIVDDKEEVIIWSPVPMVWYIAVDVPRIVPGYGVTVIPDKDRHFLDTVIRNNNGFDEWGDKLRPDIKCLYNVSIVPVKKKVHIFYSYEQNFAVYLIGSILDYGEFHKPLMNYYRKAVNDQRKYVKPNYGTNQLRKSPFS